MKKREVNFKNIQEINFEKGKEPKEIFGKKLGNYIEQLQTTTNSSLTDIKEYIGASIGIGSRSIDNWLQADTDIKAQEPKITPVAKFAKLSNMSLDELLLDSEFSIDETFSKRTGLSDTSAKAIIDMNNHIVWSNEYQHTIEKLHITTTTADTMANTYSHKTKRQEFPLWKSRELITVTFSQLLNYCVQKDKDIMEILTQLSDILNLLDDWKSRKDRADLIKLLNEYSIENEDVYAKFKNSIDDDENLKNELNAVETEVTKIIGKIVKEFILDEFRNIKSEKGEKTSNSN